MLWPRNRSTGPGGGMSTGPGGGMSTGPGGGASTGPGGGMSTGPGGGMSTGPGGGLSTGPGGGLSTGPGGGLSTGPGGGLSTGPGGGLSTGPGGGLSTGPHPWRRDNFMARAFRPAVRRAELEGLTFHDLRHTYASLMVAAGVTPHVIAEQLGHRDARLVLQRYGHLYPGASRQAALDLDLYLQAASVGQTWGGGGFSDEPSEESPAYESGACRDRTGDLRLAKPALSQLS